MGGVVVCRHGEAQSDASAPVSNVMTADSTETEPGPPCRLLPSTCPLDPHAQNKAVLSGNNEPALGSGAVGGVAALKLCRGEKQLRHHITRLKKLDDLV